MSKKIVVVTFRKQLEWVSASIVNIKSAFSHQKIGNFSIFLVIWMYFMVLFDMPRFQSSSIFFTVYWVFTHCEKVGHPRFFVGKLRFVAILTVAKSGFDCISKFEILSLSVIDLL